MQALRATNLLYTPAEERFDRITRLAAHLLGAPMSLFTLVGEDTQWFKSAHGIEALESPRDVSFCGHAILGDDTFVVSNAAKDGRFSDNPLVTGPPGIKAYAGHPLRTSDGNRIGTLCVLDRKARKFSRKKLDVLRDLAAVAEAEVERGLLESSRRRLKVETDELKRKASVDGVTRLWNQAATLRLFDAEMARAKRGAPTCVAIVDAEYPIDNGVELSERGSNAVLAEVSARVRRGVRAFDLVGYAGAREFLVILSNCRLEVAQLVCQRICDLVDYGPIMTSDGAVRARISIGLAHADQQRQTAALVVAAADAALARARKNRGSSVEVAPSSPAERSEAPFQSNVIQETPAPPRSDGKPADSERE